MPSFDTKNFGVIPYEPESIVEFPNGLPGFEERRSFIAMQFPDSEPLIFLQSVEDPALCFLTMPVLAIDSKYQLIVCDEDLERIGLARGRQPRIGDDVLCVVILSIRESGPTANLLAPVIVNLKNRLAVQAVAPDSNYSHQHVLVVPEAPLCS